MRGTTNAVPAAAGGLKLIASGVTPDTTASQRISLPSKPEFAVIGYDSSDGANMSWVSGVVIYNASFSSVGVVMASLRDDQLDLQNQGNVNYRVYGF